MQTPTRTQMQSFGFVTPPRSYLSDSARLAKIYQQNAADLRAKRLATQKEVNMNHDGDIPLFVLPPLANEMFSTPRHYRIVDHAKPQKVKKLPVDLEYLNDVVQELIFIETLDAVVQELNFVNGLESVVSKLQF